MSLTRREFGRLSASAVALGALAPMLGLSGCGSSSKLSTSSPTEGYSTFGSGNTLRAGVRSDVSGFSYLNTTTNKYYGLEIDIVNEMAARLGYSDVEFSTVTPTDRKDKLLNGEVDCLVACYSIADTRKENFDFSASYYDDDVVAVVQKSSLITSIDKMKGLTFGTMLGTNAAPLLSAKLTKIGFSDGKVVKANSDNSKVTMDTWGLRQFDSYQTLANKLEEGVVDAMVCDGAIAQAYLDDKRSIIKNFSVASQSYGVATQKDSDLSSAVSASIQAMIDDGTIEALVNKWN